eukprot:m.1093540 g.1093540  ORF g.1093540 m.1093540 type:complete len:1923 (+) comp24298_c0_seq3:345-6113(+)
MSATSASASARTNTPVSKAAPACAQLLLWHPCHEHPLVEMTGGEAYPMHHGTHFCDRCGQNGGSDDRLFHCHSCQFDVCAKACARRDDVERLRRMPRLDSVIAWAILHFLHREDARGRMRPTVVSGSYGHSVQKSVGLRAILRVIDEVFDTTDRIAGDVVECLLRGLSRGNVILLSNAQLQSPESSPVRKASEIEVCRLALLRIELADMYGVTARDIDTFLLQHCTGGSDYATEALKQLVGVSPIDNTPAASQQRTRALSPAVRLQPHSRLPHLPIQRSIHAALRQHVVPAKYRRRNPRMRISVEALESLGKFTLPHDSFRQFGTGSLEQSQDWILSPTSGMPVAGNSAWMCLLPGCGSAFSTQTALQYHRTVLHTDVERAMRDDACMLQFLIRHGFIRPGINAMGLHRHRTQATPKGKGKQRMSSGQPTPRRVPLFSRKDNRLASDCSAAAGTLGMTMVTLNVDGIVSLCGRDGLMVAFDNLWAAWEYIVGETISNHESPWNDFIVVGADGVTGSTLAQIRDVAEQMPLSECSAECTHVCECRVCGICHRSLRTARTRLSCAFCLNYSVCERCASGGADNEYQGHYRDHLLDAHGVLSEGPSYDPSASRVSNTQSAPCSSHGAFLPLGRLPFFGPVSTSNGVSAFPRAWDQLWCRLDVSADGQYFAPAPRACRSITCTLPLPLPHALYVRRRDAVGGPMAEAPAAATAQAATATPCTATDLSTSAGQRSRVLGRAEGAGVRALPRQTLVFVGSIEASTQRWCGGVGTRPHIHDKNPLMDTRQGVAGLSSHRQSPNTGTAAARTKRSNLRHRLAPVLRFSYDVAAVDRSVVGGDMYPRALRLTQCVHGSEAGTAATEFTVWIYPAYEYESIPNHIWALVKLGLIACQATLSLVGDDKKAPAASEQLPPLTIHFHVHADLDAHAVPGPRQRLAPGYSAASAPLRRRARLHALLHHAGAHTVETVGGRSRRTSGWCCGWALWSRDNGSDAHRVTLCDHVGVPARHGAVNATGDALLHTWLSTGVLCAAAPDADHSMRGNRRYKRRRMFRHEPSREHDASVGSDIGLDLGDLTWQRSTQTRVDSVQARVLQWVVRREATVLQSQEESSSLWGRLSMGVRHHGGATLHPDVAIVGLATGFRLYTSASTQPSFSAACRRLATLRGGLFVADGSSSDAVADTEGHVHRSPPAPTAATPSPRAPHIAALLSAIHRQVVQRAHQDNTSPRIHPGAGSSPHPGTDDGAGEERVCGTERASRTAVLVGASAQKSRWMITASSVFQGSQIRIVDVANKTQRRGLSQHERRTVCGTFSLLVVGTYAEWADHGWTCETPWTRVVVDDFSAWCDETYIRILSGLPRVLTWVCGVDGTHPAEIARAVDVIEGAGAQQPLRWSGDGLPRPEQHAEYLRKTLLPELATASLASCANMQDWLGKHCWTTCVGSTRDVLSLPLSRMAASADVTILPKAWPLNIEFSQHTIFPAKDALCTELAMYSYFDRAKMNISGDDFNYIDALIGVTWVEELCQWIPYAKIGIAKGACITIFAGVLRELRRWDLTDVAVAKWKHAFEYRDRHLVVDASEYGNETRLIPVDRSGALANVTLAPGSCTCYIADPLVNLVIRASKDISKGELLFKVDNCILQRYFAATAATPSEHETHPHRSGAREGSMAYLDVWHQLRSSTRDGLRAALQSDTAERGGAPMDDGDSRHVSGSDAVHVDNAAEAIAAPIPGENLDHDSEELLDCGRERVWDWNAQLHQKIAFTHWEVSGGCEAREALCPSVPNHNVYIWRVDDPQHPCYGQYALKAARAMAQGEVIGRYVGLVSRENQTKMDDKFGAYVFDIDRATSWVVNAVWHGNEIRFMNDPMKIGKENAMFDRRFCRCRKGGEMVNIVTVALRDIAADEELLVSYGKDYWKEIESDTATDCIDGFDTA